jgi:hypothetical protein
VNGLAAALIALGSLVVLHWLIKGITRKIGRAVGSSLRAPVKALLTRYYRRKVIHQMEDEKRNQGIPPLENSDIP